MHKAAMLHLDIAARLIRTITGLRNFGAPQKPQRAGAQVP